MKRALCYVLLAFAGAFFFAPSADAATTDNMSGWAWSSNIGWISFNCINESCASTNYGVNKDASGNLTGYAWNSSVGWIQFGGLSGFPTGGGTTAQNAQVVGGNLIGWAQAPALGADGWISFQGTSPTYGVTLTSLNFAGYAWSAPLIGWIMMDVGAQYPAVCTNCDVKLTGDAFLDVKSSGISIVNNSSVPYDTVPTFEWTLTGMSGSTCSVSKTSVGGTAFTTVSGITTSGSTVGSNLTGTTTYTYRLQCLNGTTTTVQKDSTFTVVGQIPAFTLGSNDTARVQVLSAGVLESELKTIFVAGNTAFTTAANPVSLFISGFPSAPASTTYTYSLDGGTSFSANPGTVQITSPYTAGKGFKMRITRLAGAPAIGTSTVTFTGTASGASNATKSIIVNPSVYNPLFEEY